MKQIVFVLFISLFSFNSFAQKLDLPKNPKPGKCYMRCIVEDGSFSDWQTIDCELSKLSKDTVKFKALQIKLSNYGYEVDITGKMNLKTIAAYKQYTKDKKNVYEKEKRKS